MREHQRGQFIPMAAMVMLSVTVFMVGIVNVYRISRAKLKAQNLADAVALYIASQMTQSMNHVADRNEWMNILYANPNDPNSTSASSDPCVVPKNSPPGLGCFASGRANSGQYEYVFSNLQTVQDYARLVQTINQIQTLFMNSYNMLLGANGIVSPSNGQSSLKENLLRNIPALNDQGVQLVVFNSGQTRSNAESSAAQMSNTPNPGPGPNLQVNNLDGIKFAPASQPVTVKYYTGNAITGFHKTPTTLSAALGSPVGGMDFQTGSAALSGTVGSSNTNPTMGAGAIVTLAVTLTGLGSTQVQARSIAYVVSSAGNVAYDTQGRASPTYWVKLGKPI